MRDQPEHKTPRVTRAQRLQRPEYTALRSAIEVAMAEVGVGQRELSRRIGQTFAFTHKLLSGQRTLEFTELIDIARAVGLDPVQLMASSTRVP